MQYTQQMGDQYQTLWNTIHIRPQAILGAERIVSKILTYRDKYEEVERRTTVPWPFVAVVHSRESDLNFKCHLHNGDTLAARTWHVPKGRPIEGKPPFTWEQSAEDALRMEGLATVGAWDLPHYLFRLEAYNGWGYRKHGVPSAYLWSGTTHYACGKYVADGQWDPNAVDEQMGCAPLLKVMVDQGVFSFPKVTR